MKTVKRKVGDLMLNERLIGLRPVNKFFVSRYRQAYRTGANMPPVIVDEDTGMIVSGNHRHTAMMEEYGPAHKVEVMAKHYDNEKQIIEEFARENVSHGNPLSGHSRDKISHALLDEGATQEEVATLFNVPIKRIEKAGEHTIIVQGRKRSDQKVSFIKRGPEISSGKMTKKQFEEHEKIDRGFPAFELAAQLVRWLKNDWINRDDRNIVVLSELADEIAKFLAVGKNKAVGS